VATLNEQPFSLKPLPGFRDCQEDGLSHVNVDTTQVQQAGGSLIENHFSLTAREAVQVSKNVSAKLLGFEFQNKVGIAQDVCQAVRPAVPVHVS